MTKVLIIDDEFLVCNYLRQLIDWEAQGYTIVGQAANGREAIEKVKELKPELIFLDINMPEMDGIEFIRYLMSEHSGIKVIILSSYSDYHYVRETMKFGACDYLLKHELQPQGLIRILRQLNGEQNYPVFPKEEDSFRLLRDNGVRRYFETGEGKFPNGYPDIFRGIRKPVIVAARMNLVAASADTGDGDWEESPLLRRILSACSEICGRNDETRIISMGDLRLIFLFPVRPGEDAAAQERRVDRCRGVIQDMLLKYYNVYLDWRQSAQIRGLESLYETYRRLPDQEAVQNQPGNFHITIKQELDLINAVTGKDREKMRQILDSVFLGAGEPLKSEFDILLGDLFSLTIKLYRENKIPFPETGQDKVSGMNLEKTCAYFKNLLDGLIDALGGKPLFSQAVSSAISYIQGHFRENIGITDIGKYCGLNSSYLSTVFKKETGTGLNQYIARVRLHEAVSLMQNKNIPPTQVYALAGFRNYNNFYGIFREITGFNPKQFKDEAGTDWLLHFNPLGK
jgi:two-component system response regulator YesN